MSEPENTVTESVTTADDGDGTVNERLTSGGPGPEGQADTAVERLSGAQPEPEAKPSKKGKSGS